VVSRSELLLDGEEASHLGCGWHEVEQGYRWTERHATLFLHRSKGQNTLELELTSGPAQFGPITATVAAGSAQIRRKLRTEPWQTVQFRMPPMQAEQSILQVSITVDRVRPAAQLGGDDRRELGVAVRAARLKGKPQTLELALSSLCNPDHWDDTFWRACLDSMAFQSAFGVIAPEVRHRKVWEYVHCVAGLTRLGCLKPSAHALGVAAGHEPVIYWLASRVAKVYATDLYQVAFSGNEADPGVLHHPETFAPYPYPSERVHFFPMDGSAFSIRDASIDLVFSLCSIEHFGSRENSRRALQEMARVLRPGGIAAVSTEVLLNDVAPQAEMFSPWELYEELIAPSGLRLIGDIAPANLGRFYANPVDMFDIGALQAVREHFVLYAGDALFTSVMLFLQKCPDN
jgi:SAM-dependent methyltransferase